MKDFLIGQIVTVEAVCTLEYDEHEQRQALRHACELFTAAITGQAIKFFGKFRKSSGGGGSGEDYEPASLKVSGSRLFWTVRTGMVNKELLVDDADLAPLIRAFGEPPTILPRQGRKIKYLPCESSQLWVTKP